MAGAKLDYQKPLWMDCCWVRPACNTGRRPFLTGCLGSLRSPSYTECPTSPYRTRGLSLAAHARRSSPSCSYRSLFASSPSLPIVPPEQRSVSSTSAAPAPSPPSPTRHSPESHTRSSTKAALPLNRPRRLRRRQVRLRSLRPSSYRFWDGDVSLVAGLD
jgi:hypothetical protein